MENCVNESIKTVGNCPRLSMTYEMKAIIIEAFFTFRCCCKLDLKKPPHYVFNSKSLPKL